MDLFNQQIEQAYYDNIKHYHNELKPAHTRYIQEVSVDYMAVSLECAMFLRLLCDLVQPQSILDLGSGFSTYVFGMHAPPECVVWTVDTDNAWLDKTKQFTISHGKPVDRYLVWDALIKTTERFELIFFDIEVTAKRPNFLPPILNHFLTPTSMIVMDDLHKPHLQDKFKTILSDYEATQRNITKYTLDKFNRYSTLITEISKIQK